MSIFLLHRLPETLTTIYWLRQRM